MNQIEELKNKIQKLVNQYNFGNYKLVIQEVNILLKKLPNNSFLLNLLGSCYQKLGDFDTAIKNFLQVLSTEQKNLAAMNNLANAYKDLLELDNVSKFNNIRVHNNNKILNISLN